MALLPVLLAAALAGPPEAEPTPDPSVESTVRRERKERDLKLELGFRVRSLSVPSGMLDIWYSDSDIPGWPLQGEGRPKVQGVSYGLQWTFNMDNDQGIVYVDWVDANMAAGYWDDIEEPPNLQDGDYVVPTRNFGMLVIGGNYGRAYPMVKMSRTRGIFGMDFEVGGGLGVGVIVGQMNKWKEGENDTPAYVRFQAGEDPTAAVFPDSGLGNDVRRSRVYPMVDFNLGLKLNFGNRVVLRLEGGLHTMLFYGASLGFRF